MSCFASEKILVALVCDIVEMYLRIGIAPEDRPFLCFLWRDLDLQKSPERHTWMTAWILFLTINRVSSFTSSYYNYEKGGRARSKVAVKLSNRMTEPLKLISRKGNYQKHSEFYRRQRRMRSPSRFDHLATICPSPSVTSCPR